ncbi:MAG: hypothetical protein VB855_19015 [Pirellulaceae bacterium]
MKMIIKWLLAMVLLAGFQLPRMAEESQTFARVVEVLQQQVQSANSSRVRFRRYGVSW